MDHFPLNVWYNLRQNPIKEHRIPTYRFYHSPILIVIIKILINVWDMRYRKLSNILELNENKKYYYLDKKKSLKLYYCIINKNIKIHVNLQKNIYM